MEKRNTKFIERQMFNLDSEATFTKRDVIYISLLAAGLTGAEIARYYSLKKAAVYAHIKRHPEVRMMVQQVAEITRANRVDLKREAMEDLAEQIKKLDTLSFNAWVEAMTGRDPRLAYEASKEQRDRRLGTPKHMVGIEGKIEQEVTHTIAPELLAALQADVLRDAPLMEKRAALQIQGEVIDVRPEPEATDATP